MVLVGMMGAGKSTAGPLVAARLGRPFVDVDVAVEADLGASVAEIFTTRGEPAFRRAEAEALARALDAADGAVVAVGGGAPAGPAGRAVLLSSAAPVVWLRARPATLAARLGDPSGRPLLAGASSAAEALAALDAERSAHYRAVATTVVDVDDLDPDATADAVVAALADAGVAP